MYIACTRRIYCYGGIVKTDEWFRCGNIDTAQMIFKNPYQEFKYEGTPPQDPKDTKHIDIQEDCIL